MYEQISGFYIMYWGSAAWGTLEGWEMTQDAHPMTILNEQKDMEDRSTAPRAQALSVAM